MIILPTGDLEVAPGEPITVTVVKSKAPYGASFSKLNGAVWNSIEKTSETTEERTFASPTTPRSNASFTIYFDFAPNQTGGYDPQDKYTVTIKGNPAEQTRTATKVPPPPCSQDFTFVVRGQ